MSNRLKKFRSIAAIGGRVTAEQSPAKARALKKLHASRRGKRVNPDTREVRNVLASVASAVRVPQWGGPSKSAVARHCGVSDRSVRRWLAGEHIPHPTHVARLADWLRRSK